MKKTLIFVIIIISMLFGFIYGKKISNSSVGGCSFLNRLTGDCQLNRLPENPYVDFSSYNRGGVPKQTQVDENRYNSFPSSQDKNTNFYDLVCRNKSHTSMKYSEAVSIALKTNICIKNGSLDKSNPQCGLFSNFIAIPIKLNKKDKCSFQCLINIKTHDVEIHKTCK